MMNSAELLSRGLTLRHLSYWTDKGYIRPVERTPGSGRPLDFPDEEGRIAEVMLRLVRAGIGPALAAKLARRPVDGAAELRRLADVVENGVQR